MNNAYYIPFILFIVVAYFYYIRKGRKLEQLFKERRTVFLKENPDLTSEQSENLASDLPWIGMDTNTLSSLFGEPRRKRVLNQSMTKEIWSYSNLFIYLNDGVVAEWKDR